MQVRPYYQLAISCFFVIYTLSSSPAVAQQSSVAPVADTTSRTVLNRPNVVRGDVGALAVRNLFVALINALSWSGSLLSAQTPVMLSYERQLKPHVSASVEGLLHGGVREERFAGLLLQGRYYFVQRKYTGPLGIYVAPAVGYRALRREAYNGQTTLRRQLGGMGVMLGVQVERRVILDFQVGAMTWGRMGQQTSGYYPAGSLPFGAEKDSWYERFGVVPDGRLGLGYRF